MHPPVFLQAPAQALDVEGVASLGACTTESVKRYTGHSRETVQQKPENMMPKR